MPQAQPPPDLNIPHSPYTVDVSIIDTTAQVGISTAFFIEQPMPGHDKLQAPCYAFLIKHNNPDRKTKYDTMLFDLAVRKDIKNSPKSIVEMVQNHAEVTVEKDVYDILGEHGEDPKNVGAIIWSHYHFDHTGNPSRFPASTDLVVGPGFKKSFVPAYPTVEDSPIDEKAYEGRTLREIDFTEEEHSLRIGQYSAYDLYGDGSFYLLDTPGHAIGHMCGLARTSADPPEFIFMGGDIAHHGGQFRPTKYLPLPENIVPSPLAPPYQRQAPVCPGSLFEAIHRNRSSTEPFYTPTTKGVHQDAAQAKDSIDKMTEFDGHNNIFINIAHDSSIKDVIEFFPKKANGWSQKQWKQEGRWRFLSDFAAAADARKAET